MTPTVTEPVREMALVPKDEMPPAPGPLTHAADTPLPIFSGAQMAHAMTAYRELQTALDQAMPDQIMELDGKPFRKKGYWRAVAVAFGVSVEPTAERREINGQFQDGKDNFGYIVTYRATAPNGRFVSSDGSCFAIEKAKRGDEMWTALPRQATEHNVRAHAHTRAFNRAVSNLVAFGEVSAEEAVGRDEDETPAPPRHADGLLRVRAVKEGTAKTGNAMFSVTFSDGKSLTTFDRTLGLAAIAFQKAQEPVERKIEQKGKYQNLVGLNAAPTPAQNGPADISPSEDEIPF